jgi:hypothetical protein
VTGQEPLGPFFSLKSAQRDAADDGNMVIIDNI